MKSFCIIPVKNLQGVKSRLSSILQPRDRGILNLCMLEDVIISVKASKSIYDIVVVSPDQEVIRAAGEMKVKTLRENREDGVNKAVLRATEFCIEEGANSSVILPSDIPLIKPLDIDNLLAIGDYGGSVVMTPSSKLDGTNALFRCPPLVMKTYYDNYSFNLHYKEAINLRLNFNLYLSNRIMLDLDSSDDIQKFIEINSNTLTYDFLKHIL